METTEMKFSCTRFGVQKECMYFVFCVHCPLFVAVVCGVMLIMSGLPNGHRMCCVIMVFVVKDRGGKSPRVLWCLWRRRRASWTRRRNEERKWKKVERERGAGKREKSAAWCCWEDCALQFALHFFMRMTARCGEATPGQHRAKGMKKIACISPLFVRYLLAIIALAMWTATLYVLGMDGPL